MDKDCGEAPNKVLKTGHKKRGLGRSLRSRRLARRYATELPMNSRHPL